MRLAAPLAVFLIAFALQQLVIVNARSIKLSQRQIELCKYPGLRRLLGWCKQVEEPCIYTSWSAWEPRRFAKLGEQTNLTCQDSALPIFLDRFRTLSWGDVHTCNQSLLDSKYKCPLNASEAKEYLRIALGGSFGNSPTFRASPPAGKKSRGGQRALFPAPAPARHLFPVPITREVALVLDSSGSISQDTFNEAVDNLARIVSSQCYTFGGPRGASQVRLAMVVFSTNVTEVFNFRKSSREHVRSKGKIRKAIQTAKDHYYRGMTATGDALQYCYDKIFNLPQAQGVERRLLLITDGNHNQGIPPAPVARALYEDLNVQVFPLAVGSDVADPRQFTKVLQMDRVALGTPGYDEHLLHHFFTIGSFRTLAEVAEDVEESIKYSGAPQCQADTFGK